GLHGRQRGDELRDQQSCDGLRADRQPVQRALRESEWIRAARLRHFRRDTSRQPVNEGAGAMPSRAPDRNLSGLRHLFVCATAIALALSTANLHAADSPRKPTRIVSTNLCTDELVLRLADLRNIASITWLSRGRLSNVAALAEQVPVNHGLAEEIIPLN